MSAAAADIVRTQAPRGRFRPELELLFTCTAGLLTAGRRRRVDALLGEPLDWKFLVHFAQQHGLAALFFWSLQDFQDAIPARTLDRLKTNFETNARKNLLLWHLSLEVQGLLECQGVQCIALKGPTLAANLYGDVALREFFDVDILVRPRDVSRARSVLVSARLDPTTDVHPRHEPAYLKSANELGFHRGPHRNILELQWQITPRYYAIDFDVEELFRRATLVRLSEVPFRTLSPEDLLLVACVHAAKHAWTRLAWLCDMAWLLRSQNLNWYEIGRQAERLGIERILLVTLGLARNFFQAALPAHLEADVNRDRSVCLLRDEIGERILREPTMPASQRNYFLLMCRLRERWRDRVRLVTRLALNRRSSDWSTHRVLERFAPAYFFVRTCRVMIKICRESVHSFAREGRV